MLRNDPENCASPFSLIPPRRPTSGKIGDEPMVRKWRSRAGRQVLIGDRLKTAKALGSEVPPMLLGRDKHRCLLAILELLGHGRLWVIRRRTHLEHMSSGLPSKADIGSPPSPSPVPRAVPEFL
jgi:hypothetical protein